ncbi:MAG TPA: hypothetical protein VFQ53_23310 [Kofleriaceae bacterium]|nr:hypothetical protein [Kofleriaceae bacterium]
MGAVLVAVAAAVGSASSNQSSSAQTPTAAYGQQPGTSPPPPQEMDAARALGLWRSTFGAVKIEADNSRGGLTAGAVHGIWTYQRQGQWIDGYFAGTLRGNVLQFKWQEPNNPPLTGEGYLVFDQQGRQYSGRWWSDRRDRVGDWNGWRSGAGREAPDPRYADPNETRDVQPPAPGTYGPQPPPASSPSPTYY